MTDRRISALLTSLIVLFMVSCGENEFQPPPPPMVTVANPMQRDVQAYALFTGTTETGESVEVRARVQGILEEVAFDSGDYMNQGDLLFRIDPEPFVAARDAAQAQVVTAEAEVKLAATRADRVERSARDGAISELQALEARAEADAAEAALLVAQKQLAIKQLDVDYTEIHAPISGLIERSPFSEGDLVGHTSDAGRLTTIYDDSEIDTYFAVSDRVYLQAIRNAGRDDEPATVEVGTEIDDAFPFEGVIDYADPTVDADSGTLQVRARIQNPDRALVGGLFVRVRLPIEMIPDAVLVPQLAITTDQVGPHVLVVNGESIVERRNVVLGPVDGVDQVVLEGLSPDDSVIVQGLLKARPGAPVTPLPEGFDPNAASAPSDAASAESSDVEPVAVEADSAG